MKGKFTVSAKFAATPEEVYKAWLSSRQHSAMTGSAAKIEPRVRGRFTAWDGYISGTTLALEPYSRIVQAWRTSEFGEAEPDSKIEIVLEPGKGGTKLTLVHSDVPDGQAESYKAGWEEWYFAPMRAYFQR